MNFLSKKNSMYSRQEIQYLEFCHKNIIGEYGFVNNYNGMINLSNHLTHYVPLSVYLTGRGSFSDRIQVMKIVLNESTSDIADENIKKLKTRTREFLQKKRASN